MGFFRFFEEVIFGTIANLIGYSIGAVILIAIYILCFRLFLAGESLCDRILSIPNKLGEWVLGLCKKYFVVPLLLSIPLLIFSSIHVVRSLSPEGVAVTIVLSLYEGSYLLQLLRSSFSLAEVLNFPTLIAMGLSSLLSFLFLRCTNVTLEATKLPKVVCFLGTLFLSALFFCVSSVVTEQILEWSLRFTGYSTELFGQIRGFFESGSQGFAGLLLFLRNCILALLVLTVMFLLAVVSVREFFATIIYGTFAIAMCILMGLIISKMPSEPILLQHILQIIAMLAIFFLPDYFRANESIKKKIRGLFQKEKVIT